MTKTASVLLWAPRIGGLTLSLFLAMFALDAFDGRPLFAAFPGFLVHLIPALLVLGALALAWRSPLVGAAAFAALALAYAVTIRWRLGWFAVIGAPLVIVAVLFALSWRYRDAFNRGH